MSVRIASVVLTVALTALAGSVLADGDGAVGYRQKVMDAVGGHMQAMVAIAKQEVPHGAHLAVHAANMAALSTLAGDLFPAGSVNDDSKALPEIWSEPAAFQERLDAFTAAAAKLDTVVKSGAMDDFGAALGGLGQACKGCHDDFKSE